MKNLIPKIDAAFSSKIGQCLLTYLLFLLHPLLFIKETFISIQIYQKHGLATSLFIMAISVIVTTLFLKTQKKLLINK